MPLASLLLLALLQGVPDYAGNCPVNVEGRLVFPAYTTPFPVKVGASNTGAGCSGGDPNCQREVNSGPDGFFQFGYVNSGPHELAFQPEGMEMVRQEFVVPTNHSAGGCFPAPGIHLDVLLHPLAKPSALTEDAVGIENLARKTPDLTIKAFAKNMNNEQKTGPKEMAATLLEVLKTAPDYYDANLELGLEYKKQGLSEDSVRVLAHALDVNSGSMLARAALGQYSYEAGDFKKAVDLLSEAARLGSKSSGVYYMLGASYIQLGQMDPAEASACCARSRSSGAFRRPICSFITFT